MGCRTYIGVNNQNVKVGSFGCLGKLVAYNDPAKLEYLKYWCDRTITDEEDKDYLKGFFDHGYYGEAVTFNQKFTKYEILDFLRAYLEDYKECYHLSGYSSWVLLRGFAVVMLAGENDTFEIEWTEGG